MFLEPFIAAFADLACCTGDGGYGYGGGGRKEGEEAVVEVGEEEDLAVGERGQEGGLVDAVEGAWFEFTYSVCACVLVGRRGKKSRDREEERGIKIKGGGRKGERNGKEK